MALFKKNIFLIILIAVSLSTHFFLFGHPRSTVFDEVHFGKFISGYATHEYFFDIHPPLGKLLIYVFGTFGGFKPGFSFAEIGQKFPDMTYLWLRLLPTLAGTILPVIIFFLCITMGISRVNAFIAGLCVSLDNALLVQSRFILLDSLLLCFGFAALLFYALSYQKQRWLYLTLAIISATLATSVKWTGLSFVLFIIVIEIGRLLYARPSLSTAAKTLLVFLIVPVLYSSIIILHLKLLYHSGPGDAFMTPGFQKTLVGNHYNQEADIQPASLAHKIIELNDEMYRANATLTAQHPYGSPWFTWPFMIRPIYYWNEKNSLDPSQESRIYFLGNPIIWWLSFFSIIYLTIDLIPIYKERPPLRDYIYQNRIALLIIFGFLINILPFIGIKRVMFLYHYMTALIFAIISISYCLDRTRYKQILIILLIILSASTFLFFAPLSYGLPLTNQAYHHRLWFRSWE